MPDTQTQLQSLHYRLAGDDDTPALLDLWSAHSGWGPITSEQWRAWYAQAPYGPALVVVAEDAAGALVAMEVFTPCKLWVAGSERDALRVSAPVIQRELRSASMPHRDQPATALYLAGRRFAVARGFAVTFSMPDAQWVPYVARGLRMTPELRMHHATLGCVALDLSRRTPRQRDGRRTTTRLSQFTDEHAQLWRATRESLPITCGVVRSPEWLQYKHGGEIVLESRNGSGALEGVVAVSRRTGGISTLMSATRECLLPVVADAVGWLADARASGDEPIPESLSAVDVVVTRDALHDAGFRPATFRFGFVADALDEAVVPLSAIEPSAWYLTTGD